MPIFFPENDDFLYTRATEFFFIGMQPFFFAEVSVRVRYGAPQVRQGASKFWVYLYRRSPQEIVRDLRNTDPTQETCAITVGLTDYIGPNTGRGRLSQCIPGEIQTWHRWEAHHQPRSFEQAINVFDSRSRCGVTTHRSGCFGPIYYGSP